MKSDSQDEQERTGDEEQEALSTKTEDRDPGKGPIVIHLSRPRREAALFELIGLTDLIVSALPPVIDHKEAKAARKARLLRGSMPDEADLIEGPAKTPEDQYRQSLYLIPVQDRDSVTELRTEDMPEDHWYGFPSAGVQAACAAALQRFNPINPRFAKDTPPVFYGATFMVDELIPIITKDGPRMRHDIARNSRGKRIDVYRGSFHAWKLRARIEYNPSVITLERLMNALELAGRQVGIGAWRPECRGRFGRFTVNPKLVIRIKASDQPLGEVA